jgi:Domain of unknown function (DUF397)
VAEFPASDREWRKSTASGSQGCVEVALRDDSVLVRDSKLPHGDRLRFSHAEWNAFLAGVRNGEFDLTG